MSDLVGAYTQNISFSSPGSQCASYGAANGTYAATFNVTKSGNTLTLLGYTGVDACHYTLNKLSGDSAGPGRALPLSLVVVGSSCRPLFRVIHTLDAPLAAAGQ